VISEGDKLPRHGSASGRHAAEKRPLGSVLTRQQRIAELAKKYADSPLSALSHNIDLVWLHEAYRRLNKNSATGVDGQSVAAYGERLEENLRDLLERAKSGRYRAPSVKRGYVPKDGKELRPIGIPTTENKVLERAVVMLLEPIYEACFDDGSYGFRSGRSAHQALASIREHIVERDGCWVVDVDIRKYFDTIPHDRLREIVRQRVKDGVVLRLIGKWLKAGTLEAGRITYSDTGTPQGGVISPMLSNIYLHEVLDSWFVEEIAPELEGDPKLVRFADDFVLLLDSREDAERMLEVLSRRFEQYGLTIHPDKSCVVDFRHPWASQRKPETFDFLGFTHYWGKTRNNGFAVKKKTASKKLTRSLKDIHQWCKENRHRPLKWQHQKLSKKLLGHYGYYGLQGNYESLSRFLHFTKRHWRYWLNRRSRERNGMAWSRFAKLTNEYLKLPAPRIVHKQRLVEQCSFRF
jgi:RNA-directed DNA polymerase